MTRVANVERRSYRSRLRAEHAAETRGRILDATATLISRGVTAVSIPGVAREAGVSVPTVYRHFGTKDELLAALYPHVARRAGLDQIPDPQSLDELRDRLRAIFERLDAVDDLTRAAMASPGAAEVRIASRHRRYERIRRLAEGIEPKLAAADRDRITRLLVILTQSASLRTWRDVLGSTVDEAADDIDWIVKAAVSAAQRNGRSR